MKYSGREPLDIQISLPSYLFQEEMNQLIINSLIWLVSHWQIQPCFFVHDTLIMGESPEAFMAMITTHTTFTKSPKRHFTGREMDNSVVDTATTELALRGDLTSSRFPVQITEKLLMKNILTESPA